MCFILIPPNILTPLYLTYIFMPRTHTYMKWHNFIFLQNASLQKQISVWVKKKKQQQCCMIFFYISCDYNNLIIIS